MLCVLTGMSSSPELACQAPWGRTLAAQWELALPVPTHRALCRFTLRPVGKGLLGLPALYQASLGILGPQAELDATFTTQEIGLPPVLSHRDCLGWGQVTSGSWTLPVLRPCGCCKGPSAEHSRQGWSHGPGMQEEAWDLARGVAQPQECALQRDNYVFGEYGSNKCHRCPDAVYLAEDPGGSREPQARAPRVAVD